MCRLALIAVFCGMSFVGTFVNAQQQPPTPQLISIFPTGGQVDSQLEVKVVEQLELEFADGLIFSHPGITAKKKLRDKNRFLGNDSALRNEFIVSIGKDVPEGVYEVRGQCEYGISNSRRFVVSRYEEIVELEPNDSFDQATELPAPGVGNGVFEAGYDFYKIKVPAGQSLLIRCVSEAIDSRGDPVIAIYNSERKLIQRNHDTRGRDSLVRYEAETDETVYIRVNDLTFVSQSGAGTTPYRLTVTRQPWIDYIDPPVIPHDRVSKVRITGRNLQGTPAGIFRSGSELETIEVEIDPKIHVAQKDPGFFDVSLTPSNFSSQRIVYRYKNENGYSNPVLVDLVDGEVIREEQAKGQVKLGQSILGDFSRPGETDQYRFSATKGQKIWVEVVSQRLGIDTDPLLLIESITRAKDGEETFRTVTTVDDFQPLERPFRIRLESEDPGVLFTVPADGEYRISLNDQFNLPPMHNGPNYYKLVFDHPKAYVDLVAIAGLECGPNDNHARPLKCLPCIVRPNTCAEIQVFAYRTPGFEDPITLSVEGLPEGVSALPSTINGQSNHGTILLSGAENLESGMSVIQVVGMYRSGEKEYRVIAAGAKVVTNSIGNEPAECRLTDRLSVVTDSSLEFPGRIQLDQTQFETAVGGTIETKAKLVKTKNHSGAILQGFLHGLPRTVSKNTNTIQDSGAEVSYKIDFRQGTSPGKYSAFVRGYFERNAKRFEKKLEEITEVQKNLNTEIQKVEAEYRTTTRNKQTATTRLNQQRQQLAQMNSQLSTLNSQVVAAEMESNSIQEEMKKLEQDLSAQLDGISSLKEKMGLEADESKKKLISDQIENENQKKSAAEAKLKTKTEQAGVAKNKLNKSSESKEKLVSEIDKLRTELEKTEQELKQLTNLEQSLSKDRTLGQNLKREIDQDVNLARQAARDRRCRFLVYSQPIEFNVAANPVELSVNKTSFSVEQGASEKMQLKLKRLFDYQGTVTVQLRPTSGGSGWSLKKEVRFAKGAIEAEGELFVQKYLKAGSYSGELIATMRNGSANLTLTIPVTLQVKPASSEVKR